MNFPTQLKYTTHDEWIQVEDDVITIGISDYAQDALGELVHIELLIDVGETVGAGDPLCEVESVKAVAEVFCPVDGEVIAFNDGLEDEEETVNEDPYGKGWLVKVKVSDASGLDDLLDAAAYEAKIASA